MLDRDARRGSPRPPPAGAAAPSPRSSSRRPSGTSIRLDDGKVEELTTGLDRGAGVRVTQGTSYGYAFSNRLDRDALLEAAEAASAALREGEAGSVVDLRTLEGPLTNAVERAAGEVPAADKVGWLRELDDAARAVQPRGGAGRRRLRRLAAATADRHERRPLGRGRPAPHPARRPGGRQARRHDPDRLPRAGRVRRRRVHRRAPAAGHRRGGRQARGHDARLDPGARGRDDGRARPRHGRACCSTRRWATRSRPTRSTRRRASTAGSSAPRARAS